MPRCSSHWTISALISRIWLQSDNEDRLDDAVAGLSPVMDRAQLEAGSSPIVVSP